MTPNSDGQYDFSERRDMETQGNYYYLYNNVLFVTLNTSAYPGGNDEENANNPNVSVPLEIIQRQKQSSIILLKH